MTTLGRPPGSVGAGCWGWGWGCCRSLLVAAVWGLCPKLVVVDVVWRCLNGNWRGSEWSWGWKHRGQSREPMAPERGLVIVCGLCGDRGSAARPAQGWRISLGRSPAGVTGACCHHWSLRADCPMRGTWTSWGRTLLTPPALVLSVLLASGDLPGTAPSSPPVLLAGEMLLCWGLQGPGRRSRTLEKG